VRDFDVRKIVTTHEEIWHDGGPPVEQRLRIGLVAAVVRNPDAGAYREEILDRMSALKELGLDLASRLLASLGGDPAAIEAYGKGAIIGTAGDIEYGAMWHEAGGWSMREVLGGTKAIVPSNKMIGALGARMMLPLGHTRAAFVRSHMMATGLWIHDAPRPDEIVYALTMATGPRVHARAGGLTAAEIRGDDGLR
jgi:hypothetical protein